MAESNVIHGKLEGARRDLLDLTTRNRLLHTARSSKRSGRLEIVDELADEIFRILVLEKKSMVFLADESGEKEDDNEEFVLLLQPDEEDQENAVAERHTDRRLQTQLTSEALQRKLLKLYYDARTFKEEQGVNILFLAIGFLKWYEDDRSDRERQAPLLLIPVELDRRSAGSRFRIKYTEDDIATNLSLQEKLLVDFGIRLPDVPDTEDLIPSDYLAEVRKAIAAQSRWDILPNDMVLWFFSFSKFLMYRDLHPDNWAGDRQLAEHPLIERLLTDGFCTEPPLCGENELIDRTLQPLDLIHVMDADSSQTLAIEEVKRGRNLVIQGPPGTGKSQTITNLIATAVKEGKRVLFVAEKMAALEVVKRRLDNIGLGDMCLELHSHKANKRAVLEELAGTLSLGRPRLDDIARQAEELSSHRDKLNRHAEIMHSYLDPAYVTPFQALGELVRLRGAGVQPADFELVAPATWTPSERQEKQTMIQDLVGHMQLIGTPQEHPWCGVQLEMALPTDVDRLVGPIPEIIARIDRLMTATNELAGILDCAPADTLTHSSNVARFGKRIVHAPAMDRHSIGDNVWHQRREEIDQLVETGSKLADCQQELQETVVDIGWSTDVTEARRDLAGYGRSWFRFLYRDYRRASATLRGILVGPPPKKLEQRLRILDQLSLGQQLLKTLEDGMPNHELARRAFGGRWRGVKSDWNALNKIARWEADCREAQLPDHFRRTAAEVDQLGAVDGLVQRITQDLKPLFSELQNLFQAVSLDLAVAFGDRDVRSISLAMVKSRLQAWGSQPEAMTKWIAYFARWRRVAAGGMRSLADQLHKGLVAAPDAVDQFQMAYYEQLVRQAFHNYPDLAQFDGVSHEQVLARFKSLDRERLDMARQEVALAHFQGLPTSGGDVGEVGIVRREMKKKRRHMPLRKMLQQAGHAIQAIKPVFMMSPISVAQYLEPGTLEFDLLVFDEASQVRPVDALGAIARAKQIVVVGDDRQLPPTRFFSRVIGEEEDARDADDFQAGDLESVLGLCEAQNMSQRMLQWHYRSRHQSLIAVSNHEFYNNRLFIIPSPFSADKGLGLKFHHVRDGVFDRGRSATNRVEARAVADAVMEHARLHPDNTLGVGAFSVAQRDAILDEVELRRRQAPELEAFFATAIEEPFFVKNLENIQGDERDVILISVGYGKDASGHMTMNFGPLNNEGGERRLNVLITRSRERCEVYASITADDIDLRRTDARGSQALKTYLKYAQTGRLDVATVTGRGHDSEFEREVARAIAGHGHQVAAQIGVAGFFVDLAVVDPDCPGRFLLGIECDGASYHSSRSARDRDRLRQQVLEHRGWIIHRIWSTDWFHRPEGQLRKVLSAIEKAKIVWASRSGTSGNPHKPAPRKHPQSIDRHENDPHSETGDAPLETIPYVEADFAVNAAREIHELSPRELATVIVQVVKTEGPVHQAEIARRVASLWGLKRTGSRITDATESALSAAVDAGQIIQSGLFFQPAGQHKIPIRSRENVHSSNLRRPDYLPPVELQAALLAVIKTHFGATIDEAASEVSRLFGFRSTSAQFRQLVHEETAFLTQQRQLEQRNGKLYAVQEATRHEPDQLVS